MNVGSPSFASDNYAGAHPAVLAAIQDANHSHTPAYGADPVTAHAEQLFRDHFGDHVQTLFTFNGTGANVVSLQAMLRPYENVICAETAHINVDECGAPERFLGSKLVDLPTPEGKLTPELVEAATLGAGDQHHVQPRVISIAQSTELGTLYSLDEIHALASWAHTRDMFLHVDGARLANAAAALDANLDAFSDLGIDVLSFVHLQRRSVHQRVTLLLARGHRLRSGFLRLPDRRVFHDDQLAVAVDHHEIAVLVRDRGNVVEDDLAGVRRLVPRLLGHA